MNITENRILELLAKENQSPCKLAKQLNISRQALHRHLKNLIKNKIVKKSGSTPYVSYSRIQSLDESQVQNGFLYFKKNLLPSYCKQIFNTESYKRFCKRQKKTGELNFKFIVDSNAVYSSKIEGNSLNLNSFLNSRSLPKKIRPKEAEEIENLVAAYLFSQNHSFNEKNMLRAHALLSKCFLNKARQGKYRKEPVGVFSQYGLVYMAIEPELVNREMSKLLTIIEDLIESNLSLAQTFFWASWIHLMIALIHPFSDGNGRVARLCEKWFLTEKLGKEMIFLPSEELYFNNRPTYYSALRLGVNYWETDFKKCKLFIKLLPKALNPSLLHSHD